MAESATIDQILGGKNQTGLIKERESGIPFLLPEPFRRVTDQVIGKRASVYRESGTQEVAQIVAYGAPPLRLAGKGLDETYVDCLHSFHEKEFDPLTVQNLINPGAANAPAQAISRAEVVRQIDHFKMRFVNLRYAAIQMALCKGYIYFDANGNLATSSQTNGTDVDYQIPSANRGNASAVISGAGKWSAAATPIEDFVTKLKRAARQAGAPPIGMALYGVNTPKYLYANTNAKAWLVRHPGATDAFHDTGEVPDGLFGLKWVPMTEAFWRDQNGTAQQMIGDDVVSFCPLPSPTWWRLIEGSMPVPTGIGVGFGDSVQSLLGNITEVFGMFAYAGGSIAPISLKEYAGDTFLPYIANRNAVYIVNVHW